MQNDHLYFCTLDVVGISFLKDGRIVKDTLRKLKTKHYVMHSNVNILRFSILITSSFLLSMLSNDVQSVQKVN